jgi:hypothetical protein
MTTVCRTCGSSVAADVRFCPHCGTATFPYYANSGASPDEPTALAAAFRTPSQIPSTQYGSNPYEVNLYDGPPPPPPRHRVKIGLRTGTVVLAWFS